MRLAGVILALATIIASDATAQTSPDREIKAAYLYAFAKFIEWPKDVMSSNGSIKACVLGADAVADSLEHAVAGRTVDGHAIIVSRITIDGPVRSCHLLYAAHLDAQAMRQLVQALQGSPVFTVSDSDGFTANGGITNLFLEDDRLRFAINVDAAIRARLHVSAKLLALASVVKDQR